jgi:hypothetical protein
MDASSESSVSFALTSPESGVREVARAQAECRGTEEDRRGGAPIEPEFGCASDQLGRRKRHQNREVDEMVPGRALVGQHDERHERRHQHRQLVEGERSSRDSQDDREDGQRGEQRRRLPELGEVGQEMPRRYDEQVMWTGRAARAGERKDVE